MTAQELYEIVRKEIDVRASTDPAFRTAQQNIDKGNCDFSDSAQCSRILAKILGEKLAKYILELPPDEGRSEVCQRLLKDHFDEVSRTFEQVQKQLDRQNGIGLGTVKPKFPKERAQNVGGSLEDSRVSGETIQRRCRNAVANVANSMHDSFIQENAKFRNDAGLFVKISRVTGSDSCKWCAEVAGTYAGYNRELSNVFRRHDNCHCTITYTSSKTRSRLVGESDGESGTTTKWVESRKSWQDKPLIPDYQPFRRTPEQAKAWEEKQLRKLGLTGGGKSDTIETVDENSEKQARYLYQGLTKEYRKEVIQKGQNAENPIFSYDTKENVFPSNAKKIPKAENAFDVATHGTPKYVEFFRQDFPDGDSRANIDAYTLSAILKGRKDYKDFISSCKENGSEPTVRLFSCSTGDTTDTGNCFAQLLANELGVTVLAPTDILYVNFDGTFYVGKRADGFMKKFYPRK